MTTEKKVTENEKEEIDNIITLTAENGEEVQFYFLDLIEYGEEEYIILWTTDEEPGEAVILQRKRMDEEMSSYSPVDDEMVAEVFEIFMEKLKDDFDFTK